MLEERIEVDEQVFKLKSAPSLWYPSFKISNSIVGLNSNQLHILNDYQYTNNMPSYDSFPVGDQWTYIVAVSLTNLVNTFT